MKKHFFIFIILIFLFVCPTLIGCGQVDFKTHAHTYISEYRKNLFVAKTGNMFITFTSGERESDYDLTGYKTPLVDFGVLTVVFDVDIKDLLPSFQLRVNDKNYSGKLEKNPFDNSYVYDIETQVNDNDDITLTLDDFEQSLKLVCISSEWKSTWEDAVEIFNQKYLKEVASHTKQGEFLGEIYVKIVAENKNLESVSWYVLCVCQDGSIYACLINPNTKEVLQN